MVPNACCHKITTRNYLLFDLAAVGKFARFDQRSANNRLCEKIKLFFTRANHKKMNESIKSGDCTLLAACKFAAVNALDYINVFASKKQNVGMLNAIIKST